MGKRAFGRVSIKLPVDFYWGGKLHEGIVTNVSGYGMYIEAGTCPAAGSDIEIGLIVGDEVFRISGKVKRTKNLTGPGGMGIELFEPSLDYRRFVCVVQDYAYNGPRSKQSLKVHKHAIEKVAS